MAHRAMINSSARRNEPEARAWTFAPFRWTDRSRTASANGNRRGRSLPFGSRASIRSRRWLALALLFVSLGGCTEKSDQQVVASVAHYSLTTEQVRDEYERVNGEGMWNQAAVSDRADFAALLLDKQMLLRIAQENCPEKDGKRARLERIVTEKTLLRMCQEWRREQYDFSPEREAELHRLLSRAAEVRTTVVSSDRVQEVTAAVKDDVSFDEILREHGYSRDGNTRIDTVTIAVGVSGREVINAVLLGDPIEGSVVGPIVTRVGPIVCEILAFQPVELDDDPRIWDTAKNLALDHDYLPVQHAFFDSLREASALQIHDEAIGVLHEGFGAYWDSVRAVPDLDFQTLRAPIWRFDAEQRAIPAYDLFGEIHSLGEFVESLNDVDIDVWPAVGNEDRIRSQVEQRVLRLLVRWQALEDGYDRNPEFLAALERMREQQQLEQFRDRFLAERIEVPEERLRQQFEENRETYQTAEQIAFGMLIFPAAEEARAREIRARLEPGQSWDELAAPEVARGTGVVFERDTGLRSIRIPPVKPSWIPFRNLASTLQPGEYSEVVEVNDTFAIVRCHERAPARPSTFEEARPSIYRMIQQVVLDEEIERRLVEARSQLKPVVRQELLADSAKPQT